MRTAWPHPRRRLSPQADGPPVGLRLAPATSPERRRALEHFIRERFAVHYGARVRHFMPCLLGLDAADGTLVGAVGLRAAEGQALFLERYLDLPIEQVLAARFGRAIARRQIVEVGNFAAAGAGAARQMIVALTEWLAALGFRWVVFTGTRALVNSFGRLGLPLQALGAAEPQRLGAEARDWGSYYDTRPMVMVGEIADGQRRLQRATQPSPPARRTPPAGLELRHVA